MCTRYHWLCCKTRSPAAAGNEGTWDSHMNGTTVAAQAELAVSTEEKRDVYWWPWVWRCGGILERIFWMLEGVWKVLCHLWQQWKYSFDTHRIPCPPRYTISADSGDDESTFYENDCHKRLWINGNTKAIAVKKGEGQSIIASKFLTSECGWLKDGDEWEFFHLFWHLWDSPSETAKLVCSSRQGRIGMGTLMQMICFNKLRTPLIFLNQRQMGLFDNTSSHQRWAPDACSAQKIKEPHAIWQHHKDGPKMQSMNFGVNNTPQDLYFADTIQWYLDGLKGWRSLSMNMGSGQRRDWTHNVRDSSM